MKTLLSIKKGIAISTTFLISITSINAQWSITGNTGTTAGTNFVGTTDAVDMVFKTNGTERIRILSTGKVGIGTNSPAQTFQVTSTGFGTLLGGSNNGTAITNIAGLEISNTNATTNNWGGILFADGQNVIGSAGIACKFTDRTNHYGDLGFATRSGGGFIEKMRITKTGNVGIGTTSPNYQLHLSTDNAAKPSTNTWTIASDARLKKDVIPFADGLEVIIKINPVKYKYNGLANMPTENENIGILAQDMQKVAPYTIGTFKTKLNPDDEQETELLNFNSHALLFVAINSIKELNRKADALEKQISIRKEIENNNTKAYNESSMSPIIMSDIILYQNEPRPFGETTTIRYFIPDNVDNAYITLNNEFGAEIKKVKLTETGFGKLNITADNLVNNIYSYSILVNDKTYDTKKMSPIK